MVSICFTLRDSGNVTYKLSQKVIPADLSQRNQGGCAQLMTRYSAHKPWRPLEVRTLCGARGIRAREIFIFRRLAFSTDGTSMEVAGAVIGFTAKMPGAWPLPKSAPEKLSVSRGMWSSNATWMARGKSRGAATRERQTLDVGFPTQSVFHGER